LGGSFNRDRDRSRSPHPPITHTHNHTVVYPSAHIDNQDISKDTTHKITTSTADIDTTPTSSPIKTDTAQSNTVSVPDIDRSPAATVPDRSPDSSSGSSPHLTSTAIDTLIMQQITQFETTAQQKKTDITHTDTTLITATSPSPSSHLTAHPSIDELMLQQLHNVHI
ncbi:hypothetical protein PFISCL1PPCAC_7898, partial [Pristionchus fissidentatus]